jgi:hypothetical protein
VKHIRIHYQREARKAQPMTRHDYILATILLLFTLGMLVLFIDAQTPDAIAWFAGMTALGVAGFAYFIGKDDQ